jgi:hypothetical protein
MGKGEESCVGWAAGAKCASLHAFIPLGGTRGLSRLALLFDLFDIGDIRRDEY